MGDKEARALGSGTELQVMGKTYKVLPITMGLLQELQREAVSDYKRNIISTYADSMELLGDRGPALLEKKLDEVASMQIDDLPQKKAYDTSHVPIKKGLKSRLAEIFDGQQVDDNDETWRRLLATALDQESISSEEVKDLSGKSPISVFIPYDSWWITGCYDGMIALIHTSLKRAQEIDKEEIRQWPLSSIAEVARIVESMTAPNMGNT